MAGQTDAVPSHLRRTFFAPPSFLLLGRIFETESDSGTRRWIVPTTNLVQSLKVPAAGSGSAFDTRYGGLLISDWSFLLASDVNEKGCRITTRYLIGSKQNRAHLEAAKMFRGQLSISWL